MSLNIKNPAAHELASRVATLAGESLTEAVTKALQERLARLESVDAEVEALLAIGQDCARRLPDSIRQLDHGTALYDDKGLPR